MRTQLVMVQTASRLQFAACVTHLQCMRETANDAVELCVFHMRTEAFDRANSNGVLHERTEPFEQSIMKAACCAGDGDGAVADGDEARATNAPAIAQLTGDAAAMGSEEPQHDERGAAPPVGVQASSAAAANVTALSQREDPEHALRTQQTLGRPAVGGASQAEGDSAAPVTSATAPETTSPLSPPLAGEQAGANVAASKEEEVSAPAEVAADREHNKMLHDIPPLDAPA